MTPRDVAMGAGKCQLPIYINLSKNLANICTLSYFRQKFSCKKGIWKSLAFPEACLEKQGWQLA